MMLPFKEIIKKHNLNITGVLHCGSSTGQERDLYNEVVDGEVIWIEAIPEVFEQLKENIKSYPKQMAINACLSNEDNKKVRFNISNNEKQSSSLLDFGTHTNIHPEVHWVDHVIMTTTRLDTLLNSLQKDISQINLLNCDLQGSEMLCIQGLGNLLKQFDYLILEVNKRHTYENCVLVNELDDFLYEYKRVETGEWVGDSWTDACFVSKKLLTL